MKTSMSGKAATNDSATLGYRCRFPAVDGDRSARPVVGGNLPRVATAPSLGVFPSKLLNLLPIVGHLCDPKPGPQGMTTLAWASVRRDL